MNYFILFSVILIVACVIVLLVPSAPHSFKNDRFNVHNANYHDADEPLVMPFMPSAASQHSFSNAAGSADGSSEHEYLLNNLLKKHDRLASSFETRDAMMSNANTIAATTTKKNGIASTSASAKANPIVEGYEAKSGEWSVLAGCSDKCVLITDASKSIGGNCVNPPISETNQNPDYSTKYCLAKQPPKDELMRAQECMTCGYYKFTAECKTRVNPSDQTSKCIVYKNAYTQSGTTMFDCSGNNFDEKKNDPICKLFLAKGGGGGASAAAVDSASACSKENCKPKEVTIPGVTTSSQKCVIPGCLSDDGVLPYPKDFYGNDRINPCKPIMDDQGNVTDYSCPAITQGSTESYDSSGRSGDPCYTASGRVDKSKFQSMKTVIKCTNVRPTSVQNFKPTNVDDNPIDEDEGSGSGSGS